MFPSANANNSAVSLNIGKIFLLTQEPISIFFGLKLEIIWLYNFRPGSGKGTQCERLIRDYGFEHISVGDVIRENVNGRFYLLLKYKNSTTPEALKLQALMK